jgi:hypothetical protein
MTLLIGRQMPLHLLSDAHEWINESPSVPIYFDMPFGLGAAASLVLLHFHCPYLMFGTIPRARRRPPPPHLSRGEERGLPRGGEIRRRPPTPKSGRGERTPKRRRNPS